MSSVRSTVYGEMSESYCRESVLQTGTFYRLFEVITVNVDIFAWINFRGFTNIGIFAWIKIRVLRINGSLGYH